MTVEQSNASLKGGQSAEQRGIAYVLACAFFATDFKESALVTRRFPRAKQ